MNIAQMKLITISTALLSLKFLNLSKCAINEELLKSLFFKSIHLRNIEVLGLASMKNRGTYFRIPLSTCDSGTLINLKVLDLRFNE